MGTTNPYFIISSIIIVGGLLNRDRPEFLQSEEDIKNPNDLCPDDQTYLFQTVKDMIELGGRFESPTIHLCDNVYTDDYIRDKPQADLTIFNWVSKGIKKGIGNFRGLAYESPLLTHKQTWKRAIQTSRTPFIAVCGEKHLSCVSEQDVPKSFELLKAQAVMRVDIPRPVTGRIYKASNLQLFS